MDQISNMITSIKNAIAVNKESLTVQFSNFKISILDILIKSGYIKSYKVNELSSNKKNIKIFLNYQQDKNAINHIKIISKPGLRIYRGYQEIPKILGGVGDVIISTPKGVMLGKEAKKQQLGGEIICEVY